MDWPKKGWRHGRWSREPRKDKDPSMCEPRRGRKLVEHPISEVVEANSEGMDEGVQNLLEEWEEEIK